MKPPETSDVENAPARRDGPDSKAPAAGFDRSEITPQTIAELRGYLRRGLRKALGGIADHEIDDFTHDAIVRILQNLPSYRGDSQFTTWAMTVAIRVAFSALRRRRHREQPVEADAELDDLAFGAIRSDAPASVVEREDLLAALRRAITEKLTERQRVAILGELRQVPSEVLAERLGITRNALYKLHHDARKKLKAALIEAGFTNADVWSADR